MRRLFLLSAMISALFVAAAAQTTAFNFQGRLNDGSSPANDRYDLQFILYDALVGGNQVGMIVQKPNLNLINGVFSTQLDFGAAAFSGGDRFLEISLRPTVPANVTPNAFVILGARQQIMSVPYAVKSLNATNATNSQNAINAQNATNAANAQTAVNSTNAANATTAQTAVNSQQLGGVAASQYVQKGGIGTVKAMAEVDPAGVIQRCFNSTLTGSASTTVPCGITVNHFTAGGYGMNFGFSAVNSFVSITLARGAASNPFVTGNGLITYERGSNGNNIDVRTARVGDNETTFDYGFMVLIF